MEVKVNPKLCFLIFATCLGVGGCAGSDGVSIIDHQSGLFGPEEYAMDSSRGDIPVVVRGSAFGLDQAALENLVIQNMEGAEWGHHARLSPPAAASGTRIYSYVIMINGPSTVPPASLCSQPNQPSSAQAQAIGPGELRVVADLCRYDKLANSATGLAIDVTGPTDPKVHELIARNVLEITKPDRERMDIEHDHGEGTQVRP
jgi:hypothetical protein